jgi:hypothetical protein
MEGHLWHHDDPTHFSVDQLPPQKRKLLMVLLDQYFSAGFSDPGIEGAFRYEEVKKLAKKYPDQFSLNYRDK